MTRCLVTGATGYVGGRLAPRLAEEGHQVRVASRDPARLRDVPWAADVEVVRADVTDAESLRAAMQGIDVAYYLVHSMVSGNDFEDQDRAAATMFAAAAADAGVQRIVYLGGMVPEGSVLSAHLRSRTEVGDILLASGVPTTVLQAAVILGSGSASFEMLRYLTERLPGMVTPRWVETKMQPIAVRDVLRYLCGSMDMPPEVNRRFDIAGPDVVSYRELMRRYARAAGLHARAVVTVPVLSPSLSSHWVNLVTPVPKALARPLIESLRYEMVAREHDIADHVPDPEGGLIGVDRALALALAKVREAVVETRWSSASWPGAPSDSMPTDPSWAGGSMYVDERRVTVDADAATLWDVIEGIGGGNGWYSFPLAWSVRGLLDRLVGGAGLRRGRRDPRRLMVGESLDWWRVEEVERGSLLRLRAEMKAPGGAWLELRVDQDEGRVDYVQRAVFVPRGIGGHLYWWAIKPFHGIIFGGMRRNISAQAQRLAHGGHPTSRSSDLAA